MAHWKRLTGTDGDQIVVTRLKFCQQGAIRDYRFYKFLERLGRGQL
jgi:hypothetical protein